jgi:hypothetical protein
MGTGLLWRPPLLALGRMHFGSINSFNQEPKEFSETTICKVEERALAKACLARFGINRMVAHLRLKTSSKEGNTSDGRGLELETLDWLPGEANGYESEDVHFRL